MLLSCPICSDTFLPTSCLVNTPCGHVFHQECVLQWFERSKTCPQCRKPTTEQKLVRLYLNINNDNSQDQDPSFLVQTIDELKLSIRAKEKDVKIANKEKEKLKSSCDLLKVENKNLLDNGIALESQISVLRKHVKNMKSLEADLKFLRQEKHKVDAELKSLKSLSDMINGSVSEADEAMLQLCDGSNSSKALVTMGAALKRQLTNKEEKFRASKKEAETYKRLEYAAKQKLKTLEDMELKPLKTEVEKLKEENASLKKKVAKMQASIMSPTPGTAKDKLLTRLLHESPMPEECKPLKNKLFITTPQSPEVMIISPTVNKTFVKKTEAGPSQPKKPAMKKSLSQSALSKTISTRQPLASRNSLSGKPSLSNSVLGDTSVNKSKSTGPKSALTSGSSLFGPSRMSQMASGDMLRKRLYDASQPPSGMVYNGLGGTVRADPTIKPKKMFTSQK